MTHGTGGPLFDTGTSARGVQWVLPAGTGRTALIDITRLGDSYCKFLDPEGRLIDCAEYALQLHNIAKESRHD